MNTLLKLGIVKFEIESIPADSEITNQPLSEKVTIEGTRNRAKNALKMGKEKDQVVGVGLEGGLEYNETDSLYYLVCVCVIRAKTGDEFLGISNKKALPQSVSDGVKNGGEFGILIREFYESGKDNCDQIEKENLEQLISREQIFCEAIRRAFTDYFSKK